MMMALLLYFSLCGVTVPLAFAASLTGQYHLNCPDHVIQAPEGGRVSLQCSLDPPLDLTRRTLDVKRSDLPVNGEVVVAYRNGREYLDPQMPQYKDRVTLDHEELPRGNLMVQIYPVNLSDSGQYTFFIPRIGIKKDQLRISSHIDLNVVSSEPESFDSSSIRPPVEVLTKSEDHVNPEKEEVPVWKIIVPIIVVVVVGAVVGVVIKKYLQKHKGKKEEGGSKQEANGTNGIPLVSQQTPSAEDNQDQKRNNLQGKLLA